MSEVRFKKKMENYRGNLLGFLNVYGTFRLIWFIVRGKCPETEERSDAAKIFAILPKRYLALASCV